MGNHWHRRDLLKGLGAGGVAAALGGMTLSSSKVWAQAASGDGLLAKLQAAGTVKVGLANQPPFSVLNADGTLGGVAPTIAQTIMTRLGVPKMEGATATYGELIPGMQAGRWDFVAAALTMSAKRCEEVLFSDPILMEGGALVTLRGKLPNPPKLVAELVAQNLRVGTSQGGSNYRIAKAAGVSQENLLQFPSDVSIIDGLEAGRIDVAFGGNSSLKVVYKQRNLDVDVTFPIADSPPEGSSCAFRKTDTDLHQAFVTELRAMKKSGEYLAILDKFGYTMLPDRINLTAEQLCSEKA